MKISKLDIKLSSVSLGTALLLVACGFSDGSISSSSGDVSSGIRPSKMTLYLTDAPNDNLTEVIVNVKHVEIWVEGKGRQARLIKAQGLGAVDLLKLRDGALLPLNNLNLPADTMVKKFRIILEHEGHYATRMDGTRCEMQTPSAEKTGLKINLSNAILMEAQSAYSLVIDFDAKKSVVQKGNGDCLLKPVLKLKSAIRYDLEDSLNQAMDDAKNEVDLPVGEDVLRNQTDVSDNTADTSTDGFDYTDPSTWPKDMTEEEFNALF